VGETIGKHVTKWSVT